MHHHGNVDPAEIEKFSTMAADWWNPFGSCKPLHEINPLRLSFIQKQTSLEGKRVLDIGCGGGILTESLAKAGASVVAIDLSAEAIAVAQDHALSQDLTIEYVISSAEEFSDEHPGEFDIITCMEMLEHVPDPSAILSASAKLLKPNGDLFLSTINRNLKSYLQAILGAEYLLKLLPKGTHEYDKFIRPRELLAMLQQENLQIVDMAGLHYQPVFRTYTLNEDVSVNYLAHARFC
jgi:2-polyprenyl-6-hydroxyphenyl methylase / 3-demethylubiquinone-9 3-methyltransferase